MSMTGFFCQDDYLSKTAKLSDSELGRLFRACMTYHATGETIELDGRESIAFDFIREDIDKAESAYREKCDKNKQNRLIAIERAKTNVDERKRTLTNDDKSKREVKRFVKPTLEEVRAYCKERGNSVDPQRFIDFYESKGWKVGDQAMKDWKACVRTWEQRDKVPAKKVIAQQYDQRDYSNEESLDDVLNSLRSRA